MKIKNINTIDAFLSAVGKCKGKVILKSIYGDVYDLKSKLSQYIAIAALLGEHGEELELFCERTEDERYFYEFFKEHKEAL